MKKQGWEAADWKAKALAANQKLTAASAQVSMRWLHSAHVCSAIGVAARDCMLAYHPVSACLPCQVFYFCADGQGQ